jgi:hypothetical protein
MPPGSAEAAHTRGCAIFLSLNKTRAQHPAALVGWLPLAACLVVWLPVVFYFAAFRRLFWFGDDWDLLNNLAKAGFLKWSLAPFAENFVPLFKPLLAGAIYLFHGSYTAIVLLLWLTHGLNMFLFAIILRKIGFHSLAIMVAVVTAGVSWTNIETLAWVTQWTSVLASTAFLLAWLCLMAALNSSGKYRACMMGLYLGCIVASPLFQSRGILTGLAISPILLAYKGWLPVKPPRALAIGSMALALALTAAIQATVVTPSHSFQSLTWPVLAKMASFGAYYYLLSPLFLFAPFIFKTVGWLPAMVLGTIKALVLIWAYENSPRAARPFLCTLLIYDLGYSLVLGYGRFHTGMAAACSSRYQYVSLFSFAPFLGIAGARCIESLTRRGKTRLALSWALLSVGTVLMVRQWGAPMESWSDRRGTAIRAALREGEPDALIANSGTTIGRARQLAQVFNLH